MVHKSAIVIGGGIVGLAIGLELALKGVAVTVLEKEKAVATHQTGRNSGVIHAGPYYAPGSLKARLCGEGNRLLVNFALEHNIAHEITGKLLLANSSNELDRLASIANRAQSNGVASEIIDGKRIREIEPFAAGIAALHVKSTGIIDYGAVAAKFAGLAKQHGADIVLGAEVTRVTSGEKEVAVEHTKGWHKAELLINAAGLHSDRVAVLAGVTPAIRIVPFRGEYFELSARVSHLVRGLIYPVPDPRLPFLGVHLTKMVGGGIHAGPNAVLAFAREGYTWRDINLKDVWSTLSYPGFSRLALKNLPTGAREIVRSLSPSIFARDLSKLVPGIEKHDLAPSKSGVRAQAIDKQGRLVDDFVIQRTGNQVHILNAPSPAATASIAIAKYVVSSLYGDKRS